MKKIIVIGDIILDAYIEGGTYRLSPEAPVPVVTTDWTGGVNYRLGGAANVALNIKAMGGDPILAGIIGDDEAGIKVCDMLDSYGISRAFVHDCPHNCTTLKTRVMANGHHIVRIDKESAFKCAEAYKCLFTGFRSVVDSAQGIIISDYNKHVVTEDSLGLFNSLYGHKGKPLIIDPKPKNLNAYQVLIGHYGGPTLFTPNDTEAHEMARGGGSTEAAGHILEMVLHSPMIITAGSMGMWIFDGKSKNPTLYGAEAKEVFDVSGAGDTVVAALAMNDWTEELHQSARIANIAAGIAVSKHKTVAVTKEEILKALTETPYLATMVKGW